MPGVFCANKILFIYYLLLSSKLPPNRATNPTFGSRAPLHLPTHDTAEVSPLLSNTGPFSHWCAFSQKAHDFGRHERDQQLESIGVTESLVADSGQLTLYILASAHTSLFCSEQNLPIDTRLASEVNFALVQSLNLHATACQINRYIMCLGPTVVATPIATTTLYVPSKLGV